MKDLGMTFTEALDALGIEYSVDFPSGGGVEIFIPEQVVRQS